MAEIRRKEESKTFSEESGNLWLITFASSIWAIHFVICYAATAVICSKVPTDIEMVATLRLGIAAATMLAVLGIGYIGWKSWAQWDYLDDYDYTHDLSVEEHRHEFLGHASFLLAVVSLIGVLFVAMPAIFMETCQ